MSKKLKVLLAISFTLFALPVKSYAETRLESNNYAIIDPNIDSSSGMSESASYGLLSSLNPLSDSRLTSGSYSLGSGFPNGIQANVPIVRCFETNTDDTSGGFPDTNCTGPALTSATGGNDTIDGNGMIGVCGEPGCYDKAKIELDHQNNPIDTLYLVALSDDNFVNNVYYLKTDKSFSTTLAFTNYMTLCELEGYDANDQDCNDNTDTNWNEDQQTSNIIGLSSNKTWYVMARAISGDYTETGFSPLGNTATSTPEINIDIDISSSDSESGSPYVIDLGTLDQNITTASSSLWIDIASNNSSGLGFYINDESNGLYSSTADYTINSETEDLSTSDGDGGFGSQGIIIGEESLGPLQLSPNFSLAGDNVRGISTTPQLVFFTDTIGNNQGPIVAGRGRIVFKAKGDLSLPAGSYVDIITLTVTSNW